MALPDPSTLLSGLRPIIALSESPEQRVLRQLLEALMFEGLIHYRQASAGAVGWQWLSFQTGSLHGQVRGRIRGFGRLRLDMESLTLTRDGRRVLPELPALIDQLPAPRTHCNNLLMELQATISNARRLDAMRQASRRADRRQLHGEDLDRALHEGHPYHPCYKSRLGLHRDTDHLLRYSPETSTGFRLHWVAVPRVTLASHLPTADMAFWQSELGQQEAFLLRAAFHRAGLDWQHHAPLPTHPWHWQALSKGTRAPLLRTHDIRSLGPLGDRYRPSQSLRSLFNMSRPANACIKVPLGIHNTSSRRHLEPHSVASAPTITRWLQAVVEGDPRFTQAYPLRLLPEYASLAFNPGPIDKSPSHPLAGELAAIWRTAIGARLFEGEQAIPLNALALWQPDGLPFIHPWIEQHGLLSWLEATLRTVILPVWHMLAAHGIGLEAHGQNSLLVIRDGWPQALLLRDFHDSVEYARDFLPPGVPEPDFGPREALYDNAPDNQFYRMSGPEALRELVMDTLFIYNLSELALLLDEAYGFSESQFWDRVSRILINYGEQQPSCRARLARLGWNQPWLRTESLLRQKLQAAPAPGNHSVPNALIPGARFAPTSIIDHHKENIS